MSEIANLTVKELGCVLLSMKPFARESDQMYLWNKFYKITMSVLKEKYPDNQLLLDYLKDIVEE
jgi:hypothetical protein